MPTCPECNQDISTLLLAKAGETDDYFYIDKNGKLTKSNLHTFDDERSIEEYRCPRCFSLLYTNKEDALMFLKYGKHQKLLKEYKN